MNQERDSLLRQVLAVNGWISGFTGLVLAVFAGTVDGWLGTAAIGVIRSVGVGLVLFAVFVLMTGRADGRRLRSAEAILVADVLWVVGSVVAVAAGWFTTLGNVLVLLVAVVVGAFAVGEAIGLRRIPQTRPA